jgi:hypothetical protein
VDVRRERGNGKYQAEQRIRCALRNVEIKTAVITKVLCSDGRTEGMKVTGKNDSYEVEDVER